jgi:transcriptional regulator with XRE-family HTH domain
MGFIEDLKKTKDGRKTFERERVLFEASELIASAMEEEGLTRAELARRLGTHKSYITQLLNGKENMTLAKVSDVLFELKRQFLIRVERLDTGSEKTVELPNQEYEWGCENRFRWPTPPLEACEVYSGQTAAAA